MSNEQGIKKTTIEVVKDGPLKVTNLESFYNSKGEDIPVKDQLWLCRCGASKNKPFCDGSHVKAGFKDEKN